MAVYFVEDFTVNFLLITLSIACPLFFFFFGGDCHGGQFCLIGDGMIFQKKNLVNEKI